MSGMDTSFLSLARGGGGYPILAIRGCAAYIGGFFIPKICIHGYIYISICKFGFIWLFFGAQINAWGYTVWGTNWHFLSNQHKPAYTVFLWEYFLQESASSKSSKNKNILRIVPRLIFHPHEYFVHCIWSFIFIIQSFCRFFAAVASAAAACGMRHAAACGMLHAAAAHGCCMRLQHVAAACGGYTGCIGCMSLLRMLPNEAVATAAAAACGMRHATCGCCSVQEYSRLFFRIKYKELFKNNLRLK